MASLELSINMEAQTHRKQFVVLALPSLRLSCRVGRSCLA